MAPPTGDGDGWLEGTALAGRELGFDEETATTCALPHGTRFRDALALVRDDAELAHRCHPELPFARAELVQAVRSETTVPVSVTGFGGLFC